MMYSEKVAVAIKVGGRVLREAGDLVSLPFGSEYSIFVRNLNSVRAQVNVSIDGKNVSDGSLVIGPNSSVEIERFIKNGNLQAGNRFKFIERTAEIEAHKGIGSDDGLIRVEAWKEHVTTFVDVPVVRHHYYDEFHSLWSGCYFVNDCNFNNVQTSNCSAPTPDSVHSKSVMRSYMPQQERGDAGITVPGSESRQQFHRVSGFALEPNSTVIVIRLRGDVGGQPIAAPITVDHKPTCETCGKVNKANDQFCSKCGTALLVFA